MYMCVVGFGSVYADFKTLYEHLHFVRYLLGFPVLKRWYGSNWKSPNDTIDSNNCQIAQALEFTPSITLLE